MSADNHARTPLDGVIALLFTLLAVGLAYWLWYDVDPLLRALKGVLGNFLTGFLGDLRLVVKVAAVFLLVSIAGLALDHGSTQYRMTRVVAIGLLALLVVALLRYGTFFSKTVVPVFKSFFS